MVGGHEIRMCTSRAPAWRIMRTILRLVVPRTKESSTRTTRLPSMRWRTGLSFSLTPKSRIDCLGSMKLNFGRLIGRDQLALVRGVHPVVARGNGRRAISSAKMEARYSVWSVGLISVAMSRQQFLDSYQVSRVVAGIAGIAVVASVVLDGILESFH